MSRDSFAKQLNFWSDSEEESPPKKSCHEDKTGSPERGITLFGSAYDGSPVRGMTLFGSDEGSPVREMTLFGGYPEDEEFPFVPAVYDVDLTKSPPSDGIRVPMPEFFKELEKAGSISPTTTPIPSTGATIKSGSFFGFSPSPDGLHAIKTATLGSNGFGTINKKELVKVIHNTGVCCDSPLCASVSSFHIDHRMDEKSANVIIVQELCDPLQIGDDRSFLLCVISLLRWLIPKGFYPTDLKKDNFGKDKAGNVKLFDFDLKEFLSTKACSFIKSGEFQHDGNPMFQQFILMLMDFYRQIDENRKSEFAKLNNQAGLLKSLGLLSDEKSISETTIDDFAEVLRKIGLFDEDIAYLVGLIVPPASSQ